MAPAVSIENSSDFAPVLLKPAGTLTIPRTLLLSPPSLSSHPEKLDNVLAAYDRNATDIQMLDRLSLSLVSLPQTTYDIILILLDADNSRTESRKLLSGDLLSQVIRSLKPGGKISSQDGDFGIKDADERREAVLAGLMLEGTDMVKPNYGDTHSVPLRFSKQQNDGAAVANTSAAGTGAVSLNLNGKRKNGPSVATQPAGVGYIDHGDDFDTPEVDDNDDEDDELIDEDTLLDEEDMKRPVIQRKWYFDIVESGTPMS